MSADAERSVARTAARTEYDWSKEFVKMIRIIAVLCSLASPTDCHEQVVTTSISRR